MAVIIIIGYLVVIDITDVASDNNQKRVAAEKMIWEIESVLDIYCLHNGFYPTTEQGLNALVTKPTTDPQPTKYLTEGYIKKVPVDPWGNPFIYRSYGKEGPIYIISSGRDGKEGTEDDIANNTDEPPADASQKYEIITEVPEVTDDFPEAALSAFESFKRIDKEFPQRRYRFDEMGGERRPVSPYVFYDEYKSLPSIDNSIFVYGAKKTTIKDSDNTEEDTIRVTNSVSFLNTIRDIVGEEYIRFNRQWAFDSYGDFNNFLLYTPSLKHERPLSYEKFLMSVFLSLSEIRIGMPDSVYLSFVEEVLLPLSHDLSQKGPARPSVVVDNDFINNLSCYVRQDRSKLPKWLFPTKYLIYSFTFPEPIPPEILWSGIYRKIDHLVGQGYYKDPYYLFNYYKTLSTEKNDAITWGEALDVDIWFNYYINSLIMHKEHLMEQNKSPERTKRIEEIENLILYLRRKENVF